MRHSSGPHRPIDPSIALVLVDVIHDLEFPGGELLLDSARAMAERTADLKRRARLRGIPAVYVNEEDDRFRPSFVRQVERCLQEGVRGRPIVELLRPDKEDFVALRSERSACYLTALDTLLQSFRTSTLIFTGMAASLCLLLTASDSYLSGFHLLVPSDCVAARTEADKQNALEQMRCVLGVDTRPSSELTRLVG
ncbi:MAG: cysteine hydrolase family protein [Thermoguttaceae bacterium]|jgi:nicotinamidase-related amidase